MLNEEVEMNSRNRYPLAGFSSLVVCSFFAAGVNADSGLTSAIFVEQGRPGRNGMSIAFKE